MSQDLRKGNWDRNPAAPAIQGVVSLVSGLLGDEQRPPKGRLEANSHLEDSTVKASGTPREGEAEAHPAVWGPSPFPCQGSGLPRFHLHALG